MKKLIEVEFPDNFKFPEQFDQWGGACVDCPLFVSDSDGYGICLLDPDNPDFQHDCPLKDGAEKVCLNRTKDID